MTESEVVAKALRLYKTSPSAVEKGLEYAEFLIDYEPTNKEAPEKARSTLHLVE
jgi:hypothetical protein